MQQQQIYTKDSLNYRTDHSRVEVATLCYLLFITWESHVFYLLEKKAECLRKIKPDGDYEGVLEISIKKT